MEIIDKTHIKYRFNRLSPKVQVFMKLPYEERKSVLNQKYIIEQQSISEISRYLETTSRDRVRILLNEHEIKIRDEYFVDLTGRKIGDITVIRRAGYNKHQHIIWACRCNCGHYYNVESTILIRGVTKQCHHCMNTGNKSRQWTGCGKISGAKFSAIRQNATARKIEFNLTIEYLWELYENQNGLCALSGTELTFSRSGKSADGTASLDRVDNKRGYTKDNVQWINKDINYMKQDFDEDYFIKMCHLVSLTNLKTI